MEHLHTHSINGTPDELDGIREHRVVYTPASIVAPAALLAVAGSSVFTGTAAHTYIVRTFHFNTNAAAKTVTISIKADAVGTRLLDAYALTQSVPFVLNGWYVIAGAGAHDIDANSSATTVVLGAFGYDYT